MFAPIYARIVLHTLLVGALLCLAVDTAWACPGCKEAIKSQENGANIALGYQYSILFMMAMPFTMLALFSAYMYWEIRRAQAAKDAEAAEASASLAPPGSAEFARPDAAVAIGSTSADG